jgi:hypothetical protein
MCGVIRMEGEAAKVNRGVMRKKEEIEKIQLMV